MEEWKVIQDYPDYMVSDLGRVKSFKGLNEIIMKLGTATHGYKNAGLTKDGKFSTYLVHRLVASAFIVNDKNKRCVNHKNEIKDDNRLGNLEWCTHKENSIYSIPRFSDLSKVKQLNVRGEIIALWNSFEDVVKVNFSPLDVKHCCRYGKSYKGFGWEFLGLGEDLSSEHFINFCNI